MFPALQAANADFYGLRLPETYWRDIGTLPEYRAATHDVLAGRIHLPSARTNGIPACLQGGADLHIEGDVCLGTDVVLGHRVHIIGPR